MNITLHELFLDGVLVAGHLAVWHVEAKVGPLVGRCGHPSGHSGPVGDGDGVSNSEVHGLHDPLSLELPAAVPDGCHGGHVAAGAEELLAVVVVVMSRGRHRERCALFHVLKTSPDDVTGLLWDLQGA